MADKIYEIPEEWKKRAYINEAKYKEMYARSIKDPNGFWAEEAKRIHWYRAPTKIKNTSFGPGNVSIKWFEDGVTNAAYNCIDRHLPKRAKQTAIIWEGDDPSQSKHITLSGAARRGLPVRQHPAQPQRREGRPRHHLPADDPGGRLRDAGLRAHRRHPLGGVRRLLARLARRPHRGLRLQGGDHRRRGRPRRPQDPAQGQHRRRHRQGRRRRPRHRGAPHRRRGRDGSGARRLLPQGRRGGDRRMPVRAHERRGPAVHPLHVGLDRQAEGRAAHHRRLPRLRGDDAPIRLRLPRRRHLLVHRRRRLGHRPQLHRVRAAGERRHHLDVRGRAELPDHVAVLGGLRQAPRSTPSTPRRPRSAR